MTSSYGRRRIIIAITALAIAVASPGIAPLTAAAASCVRLSGGQFDAPGNDNLAANLNGEYIRVKNTCTAAKSVAGWKIHDYGKKYTHTFPAGFSIKPGVTVTVYSGRGTNTATKRYWGHSYGAIWNNSYPEKAYLRNASGTLISSWTPY